MDCGKQRRTICNSKNSKTNILSFFADIWTVIFPKESESNITIYRKIIVPLRSGKMSYNMFVMQYYEYLNREYYACLNQKVEISKNKHFKLWSDLCANGIRKWVTINSMPYTIIRFCFPNLTKKICSVPFRTWRNFRKSNEMSYDEFYVRYLKSVPQGAIYFDVHLDRLVEPFVIGPQI